MSKHHFRLITATSVGSSVECQRILLQVVNDLRTLRTLAEYLLSFDCISFLSYLEALRASESVNSVWLFHEAAHIIFEQALPRCYEPYAASVALWFVLRNAARSAHYCAADRLLCLLGVHYCAAGRLL